MNSYSLLVGLVNENLKKAGCEAIYFESYDNLSESIYKFPVQKLLEIKNDAEFVREVYFKMLDRPVDMRSYNHLVSALKKKTLSRKDVIKNVFLSDERKIKQTFLIGME